MFELVVTLVAVLAMVWAGVLLAEFLLWLLR